MGRWCLQPRSFQGILKSILVNKLTTAGCHFIFWVADWFALLNNKLGGDLRKIRTTGRYMIEVRIRFVTLQACLSLPPSSTGLEGVWNGYVPCAVLVVRG